MGHILIAVDNEASPATVAKAEQEANSIYEQLKAGADFRQMAIAHSSDSRALEGGDLGWRKAGELPSLFAEQVFALEVGQTAAPIRSGSGFHIVQLLEKRGAGNEVVEQTLVRHILVKPSEIRSEADTQALIQQIHDRIVKGEDFAALARLYSEDPGSALAGGDLGWSEPEKFAQEFGDVMKETPTGKLSEPFHTKFGWHVLQVMDRRQHDMSEDARRNLAIRVLHNRRYEEELQEWLKEIRDEAYVEIRVTNDGKPKAERMKAPLALTTGEPAGIGPDLAVAWAQRARDVSVVAVADPDLLRSRAKQLGHELTLVGYPGPVTRAAGSLSVQSVSSA